MKFLIVCKSIHHGNTMRVARAIAEVLEADLKEPEKVEGISDYDTIGFGSGIYIGNFHKKIIELVEDLTGEGKNAFIFSTSGLPNIPLIHNFNGKMRNKLDESGFNVVDAFNCRGFSTDGPFKLNGGVHKGKPDENDLKDARKFAEEALKSLNFN